MEVILSQATFTVELKYLKNEQIVVSNNLIQCKKTEMKLQVIPRIFGPFSYFYWWSIDNEYLVRYEGPGKSKDIKILKLIKAVNYAKE